MGSPAWLERRGRGWTHNRWRAFMGKHPDYCCHRCAKRAGRALAEERARERRAEVTRLCLGQQPSPTTYFWARGIAGENRQNGARRGNNGYGGRIGKHQRGRSGKWQRQHVAAVHAARTAFREACQHEAAIPPFDEQAAAGLGANEIRRRWPRGSHCPTCGLCGIFYASFSHYIAGDY